MVHLSERFELQKNDNLSYSSEKELFKLRVTGTPKACWICYKPTTTVLATIDTVDFLYACDNHLTDRGFASQVGESSDGTSGARKLGLNPEEIAKVKEEWEDKQKRKAEKEKEKEKEKAKEEKSDDKKDNDERKEGSKSSKSPSPKSKSPGLSPPTPQTPSATHQRFTLHRDMFAMRLAEHRKRRQAVQAKELAPRLPGAPRGDVV